MGYNGLLKTRLSEILSWLSTHVACVYRKVRLGTGFSTSTELKGILESVLRGMALISTKGMAGLTPDDEVTVILKDNFQKEGGSVDRIYAAVRAAVRACSDRDISRSSVVNGMRINSMKFLQNTPTRVEPVIHQHFCRSQV